jgi:glycyl-tRNA synthetase beta chain
VIAIYAEKRISTSKTSRNCSLKKNLYNGFKQRCETILAEQGIEYDLVDAVRQMKR